MNRFIYQLTIRPAGPDSTPYAPGRDWHDTDVVPGYGLGSVSYDEALTLEQIQHWALLPLTQMQALNGQYFRQPLSKSESVLHHITLSDDFRALRLESYYRKRDRVERLSYADFCQRSKLWQPAEKVCATHPHTS